MVGNRVLGHSLILCMAVALLLTPWGELRHNDFTLAPESQSIAEDLKSQRFAEDSDSATMLSVSGLNGRVAIGGLMIPYWGIIACLAMGSVIASLNWLRLTQISSLVTFALFGMATACSLVATLHFVLAGQVGTGSVLAITCALAGLAMCPADPPAASMPVIHRYQSPERKREAA